MILNVIIFLGIKLLLLCCVIKCDWLCISIDSCPPDKPFCTSRGCVFECPSSAYVNGTKCVAECGSLFVLNKTCVDHCPSKTFIREIPKLLGREIYIEKLCTTSCGAKEYLFNDTCVHACPVTHKYINGRNCSSTCKEDTPFLKNFTINNITFHDCVKECEYFSEDGYCTAQCSDKKNILNSVCTSSCPSEYPFIFGQHCVQNCPDSTVQIERNTCLTKCPLNMPFYYNDSCVSHCPTYFYRLNENGMWHCIKQCPKYMFINNQTCVSSCPNGTFINNKTCGNECSTDFPFTCQVQDSQECVDSDISIQPYLKHTICVQYCPKNTYVFDSACVSSCPSNYKYFNTNCVQTCPNNFPYVYNNTVKIGCSSIIGGCDKVIIEPTCSQECPINTYSYNKTCHQVCPIGQYMMDRKCVTACPELKPLKQHRTISFKSYQRYKASWYPEWKELNTKSNITECVADCGDDSIIFNLTCSKRCPENMNYVTNSTCHEAECDTKYMKNKSFFIQCLDTCEGGSFVYNRTCTKECPKNTFPFNGTCVDACPRHRPFVLNRTIGIKCDERGKCASIKQYSDCESECPTGTFILNNTCLDMCPSSTFVLENYCVNNCTAPYQYYQESTVTFSQWRNQWNGLSKFNQTQRTTQCVDKCSSLHSPLVYNLTCYKKCPKSTYSLNNLKCVHECPDENPLKFTGNDTWLCLRNCGDDKVFDNGHCRYTCTNHSAISYEGKCIDRCPEGYFWWYYTCNSRVEQIVASVFFFGIDLIILIFGKKLLHEYFIVIGKLCSRRKLDQENKDRDKKVKELTHKYKLKSKRNEDIEMTETTDEALPLMQDESIDEDTV